MPDTDDIAMGVLADVIGLSPARRRDAIARACGSNARLRERVEALAAEYESLPDEFLGGHADLPDREAPLPERIAHYRVLGLLGQGGMGVVYDAEQVRPARRVALKVIRPGRVSDEEVSRFLYEAEILGQLQHPGIAQVYEAGVARTPYGDQPYFAMERVEGPSLDRHATDAGLDLAARVELFTQICDAVQAAHDRGFVHRDLKPANILVAPPDGPSAPGRPKILDFGVARAIGPEHVRGHQTEHGRLVGTLSYMSPEQVDGAPVDARCDVYALGVIIYELLTGRLPHDTRDAPIHAAAQAIREEEPTRPGVINPALRGDLSTVIAKALEKDPDRRYPSAAALAEDLRRVLRHEPVRARPPSRAYQLRKFTRRNRALVGAVASVMLALAAGGIIATHYAFQSAARERLALRESYRAAIAAAAAAVRAADVADAKGFLDRCPPHLRGWEWDYLNARLDGSLASVELVRNPDRPGGPRTRLAFTPDGGAIIFVQRVIADEANYVSVRNSRDLSPIREWRIQPQTRSAFRENAETLIIWNTSGLREHSSMTGDPVSNESGTPLAETLRRIEATHGRTADLKSWPPTPDAPIAVLAGNGVLLIDPDNGEPVTSLPHPEGAADTAYAPDGRTLYTAGRDRCLRAFTLPGGGTPVWSVPGAHNDAIRSVAVSPDGSTLATGSEDRTIRLWDAATGTPRGTLIGHEHAVSSLAFAPDAHTLASGDGATLRLWDLHAAGDLFALRGHTAAPRALALSGDGRLLATAGDELRVWDTATFRLWYTATLDLEDGTTVTEIRFAPDGEAIEWTTQKNPERAETSTLPPGLAGPRTPPPGDTPRVISNTHDAEVLIYRGDRLVSAWSLPNRCATLSPDGHTLAVGDRTITLYDTRSGDFIAEFAGKSEQIHCLAFHPDGSRLASGSDDRVIRLWDVETATEITQLRGHLDRVLALAFTPDGRTLFSASGDRTVRAWTTSTAREIIPSSHSEQRPAGTPNTMD